MQISTVDEVAEALRVSSYTIYVWVRNGKIPSTCYFRTSPGRKSGIRFDLELVKSALMGNTSMQDFFDKLPKASRRKKEATR